MKKITTTMNGREVKVVDSATWDRQVTGFQLISALIYSIENRADVQRGEAGDRLYVDSQILATFCRSMNIEHYEEILTDILQVYKNRIYTHDYDGARDDWNGSMLDYMIDVLTIAIER